MTQKKTKHDKKNPVLQVAKIAFFSKHCHFSVIFCDFGAIFLKIVKQIEKFFEKWQKNDKQMTMLREKCNFCHLQKFNFLCLFFGHVLSFCGKFVMFLSFGAIFAKILKKRSKNSSRNDRKMTDKWQKNDNASRKMLFLPPAKVQFFLSFVCLFLGHFVEILSFFVILVQFFQK